MKISKTATQLLLILLVGGLSSSGCNRDKKQPPPGKRLAKTAATTGTKGSVSAAAPAGPKWVLEHFLVKEPARIELRSGGLFLDLGSPDQHKYTWGQVRKRWGHPVAGPPSYLTAHAEARLFFTLLDEPFVQVWLRARSAITDQTLAMKVEGFKTEPVTLTSEWKTYKVPMPRAPSMGHKIMKFFFGKPGAGAMADIDWLWLRTGREEHPAPTLRTAVRTYGQPMRGLVADGDRSYSYYLSAPPRAALELSFGATCACSYSVKAHMDGMPLQTLVEGTSIPGKWNRAKADLSELARKPGRLIFTAGCPKCEATWGDPVIRRPAPIPQAKQNDRPIARNLIYVVMDAARQDLYRPFNGKSPVRAAALEELAMGGTIFPAAQTNSNWTLPSVATLLTGTYLSRHLWSEEKLRAIPPDVPIISKHLRSRGFATAAFVSMPIINGACGFKRGWDHFENRYDKTGKNAPVDLYPDAIQWIKKNKGRRFFVYLHPFGPHLPLDHHKGITDQFYEAGEYKGPLGKRVSEKLSRTPAVMTKFTEADRARVVAMYRGEAAYNDHYLGRFIKELKQLGRFNKTLVVFTNDHGEELFDRGGYGHGHGLHSELIASPLIMHFPPIFKPGLISQEPISLVDIVPTSLEVLGLAPMRGLHGVSVLPALRGRPALEPPYLLTDGGPERAVRMGSYKLMLMPEGMRLYDLAKDPGEKVNLIVSHQVTARALEVMLGEGTAIPAKRLRLQGMAKPWSPKPSSARLDSQVKRRLKALGYVGN